MREIKFRAWDVERKEMIQPDKLIGLEGEASKQLLESSPFLRLEQFTGLTDKDGKEIYEGDILTVNESGVHEKWAKTETVMWDDVRSGFAPFCHAIFYNINFIIEIIGNIHENADLTK